MTVKSEIDITFKLGEVEESYFEWLKHHKQVAIHVKREYVDTGEVKLAVKENDVILKTIKENEDRIIKAHGQIYDKEKHELKPIVDYLLLLDNVDYIEPNIEYYSVGAMNTKSRSKVRLFFKLDSIDVILDYQYKTSGSFALTFHDLISGDGVADIINEIAIGNKELHEKGIEYRESDESYYYVYGLDENKRPIDLEVSMDELLASLISVELYEDHMEIID